MSEAGSFPRTDALDVIVELISELDERPRPGGRGFYDRLCEALCRQASMRRAGLMLYDDARRLVVPVGSHGLEADLLAGVYGSLEETPIAQMALSQGPGGAGVRPPRALGAGPLRRLRPADDAHLHARVGRRALAGRDLRGPRRRAVRAERRRAQRHVDDRQDGGARRERAHRDQPAGTRAAAPGPDRPRARDPRGRGAAPVRRLAGARLGDGA